MTYVAEYRHDCNDLGKLPGVGQNSQTICHMCEAAPQAHSMQQVHPASSHQLLLSRHLPAALLAAAGQAVTLGKRLLLKTCCAAMLELLWAWPIIAMMGFRYGMQEGLQLPP